MSFNNSVQYTEKMCKMTLLQLLQIQNSLNVYALALAKSRNEQLTPQLAIILQRYVTVDGDKWLQVVRRLISNNYFHTFHYAINIEIFLRPIISELYILRTSNTNSQQYIQKIWYKIHQSIKKYNINPGMKHITGKNFQFFIQTAIKYQDIQILQEIFVFLSNQSQIVNIMLTSINSLQNLRQENNNFNQIQSYWERHQVSVKLLLSIVILVEKMEQYAVKQIRYDRFLSLLSNKIQQKYSIACMIQNYLPSIISLLSTININPQIQHNMSINIPICPTIYTIICKKSKNKLTDYYSKLCLIITHLSMISSLQLLFLHNTNIKRQILNVIQLSDIIMLNNYMYLDKQLLAINGEICSSAYSDTLTGNFMKMIIELCNNIGGFFNLYFSLLENAAKSNKFMDSNSNYFINYLLKISLLSDSTILLHRQHTIQNLLVFTAKLFSQRWTTYNQWQQVQVLRYFMIFVNRGEGKGLGVTETAEELVCKCIDLCIASLQPCFNTKMDEENNFPEIQFTPLQQQCYDLLKTLPETSHTLRLMKQSLLPNILTIFIRLPPTTTFIDLFHNYLINIPELISRSSEQIIEYFSRAFINQKIYFENLSKNSFKNLKCTEKISKIIKAIITILTSESQLSFDDIEQKIVEPILSNLGMGTCQSYQDQLLQLLQTLLIKHSHLTHSVCQVISKLPSIYQKNQKKLSILRNIYKALCISNEIKRQIEYQYGDIIMIMLLMANDYIENNLNYEEVLFYPNQVKQLIYMINIFLNKYTAKILEDEQMIQLIGFRMFNGVVKCLQNAKVNLTNERTSSIQVCPIQYYQLLFQLEMLIAHICIGPTASKFNQKIISQVINEIKIAPITSFFYIQTIKMIPVIIIDQLIINATYHERVISDLVIYCQFMGKIQIEGGMNKQWKNIEGVQYWDQWPKDVKKYVHGLLRELRNRKQIDNADHVQYLEAMDRVLF